MSSVTLHLDCYIGAAARIAQTMGLHLGRAVEPHGCLQGQADLRLYATLWLCLLDVDIALCYGCGLGHVSYVLLPIKS